MIFQIFPSIDERKHRKIHSSCVWCSDCDKENSVAWQLVHRNKLKNQLFWHFKIFLVIFPSSVRIKRIWQKNFFHNFGVEAKLLSYRTVSVERKLKPIRVTGEGEKVFGKTATSIRKLFSSRTESLHRCQGKHFVKRLQTLSD